MIDALMFAREMLATLIRLANLVSHPEQAGQANLRRNCVEIESSPRYNRCVLCGTLHC